jgi:GYF domain 2/Interferon-induced transmembrane protein
MIENQHQEDSKYFFASFGQQVGPFGLNEFLAEKNILPDTLVWKTGLPNWVPASELLELNQKFAPVLNHHQEDSKYFFASFGQQVGPFALNEFLAEASIDTNTLVWKTGLPNWVPAYQMLELRQKFPQATSPNIFNNSGILQQGNSNASDNNPNINTPFVDLDYAPKTYLSESVMLTIVGFLLSCFGGIPGIVAIVNASKTKNLNDTKQYRAAEISSKKTLLWVKITCYVSFGIFLLAALIIYLNSLRGERYYGY